MRPSMLIVSCQKPEHIKEALASNAGNIIFDLEDNVSIAAKDKARETLLQILPSADFHGKGVIVRINPIDTEYGLNDLEALRKMDIDAIVLPKATLDNVTKLDKMLEGTDIKILPLIESCISVEQSLFIVQNTRVLGLMLGAEDLCADLEVSRTKGGTEILYARQRIVNACKAVKKECFDTYFTDVEDSTGLMQDTSFANSIGFTGKACLSVRQISCINQVFIPTQSEVLYAKEVIRLANKEKAEGNGPYSIKGKMIDRHMITRAEKLLEKAKISGIH